MKHFCSDDGIFFMLKQINTMLIQSSMTYSANVISSLFYLFAGNSQPCHIFFLFLVPWFLIFSLYFRIFLVPFFDVLIVFLDFPYTLHFYVVFYFWAFLVTCFLIFYFVGWIFMVSALFIYQLHLSVFPDTLLSSR